MNLNLHSPISERSADDGMVRDKKLGADLRKKNQTSKSIGDGLRDKPIAAINRFGGGDESGRSLSLYSKAGSQLTGAMAEKHRELRERNEANKAINKFRKSFTQTKEGYGLSVPTHQERLQDIPLSFKDWQECVLYTFYTINYFDEQLFNVMSSRCSQFRDFEELSFIALNERHKGAFNNLTYESSNKSHQNLNRIKLENMAF